MYKIAIDHGHGIETPGKRTPIFPNGTQIKEKEFNRPTALFLIEALERCGAATIDCSPGWEDTSLGGRVKIANEANADLFISVHYNAKDGKWWGDENSGGTETYSYPGSIEGAKLATVVQKHLAADINYFPNRGAKTYNFYVCRETNNDMPAILCECGFMDILCQAELMKDESHQRRVAEAICKGVCEYLGMTYVDPSEEKHTEGIDWEEYYKVPIMGKSVATAAYLWGYLTARGNHNVPAYVPQLFIEEGEKEGVRGDIAFCQSMHETNFFNFTGIAKPEWFNPAGLGVTGPAGVGERFASWRLGIRAMIQHLKAYGSTEPLNGECVDNRFKYVKRGCAPTWCDLGGKWAVPGYPTTYVSFDAAWAAGKTYGQILMQMYVAVASSITISPTEESSERDKLLKELSTQINTLQYDLDVKTAEVKKLTTDLAKMTTLADGNHEAYKKALEAGNKLTDEVEKLQGQILVKQKALDKLTEENNDLHSDIELKRKKIEDFEKDTALLVGTKEVLEKNLEDADVKIQTLLGKAVQHHKNLENYLDQLAERNETILQQEDRIKQLEHNGAIILKNVTLLQFLRAKLDI